MRPDRWQDLKTLIKDKYNVLEEKNENIEYKTGSGNTQKVGEAEIIVFESPLGKTKLKYITKPIVLEKKEHYSKRMGTASMTEYLLSENEFSYRLEAFIEKDGIWEEFDPSNLTS